MPSTVPERKKKKKEKKTNDNEIRFVKLTKKRKGSLHLRHNKNSKNKKNIRKRNKKDTEKTREKAIKGLTDFNKFIRDNVAAPGQRRSFDFRMRSVKQESFFPSNKIAKNFVKRARNLIYKKDTVFVNSYNKFKKKKFLEQENLPLCTLFVKINKALFVKRCIVLVDLFKSYKLI